MKSYALTDIGMARSSNQDFVYASDLPLGNLDNFYLVADGMGGHQGGGFASRYAVERITEELAISTDDAPVRAINGVLQKVNKELYVKSNSFDDLKGMGTTIVAATITDGVMTVANIGDSRLYVVSIGSIKQITKDHSLVEQLTAEGKITRDSDFFAAKKNIITRALGVRESVAADFFEVEIDFGDRLILCSDGLSNMVSDDEIQKIVSSDLTCREIAENLVRLGNQRGGRDNISVVIINPDINEVDEC